MTSPAEPAVVLLAHGSPDPRHREGVDALLTRVQALAPRRPVVAAYLDHHGPSAADIAADLSSGVVVPVLLTRAYHAKVDIPAAVGSMGPGFVRGEPLGPSPLLLRAAEELLARNGIVPDSRTHVVLYAAGSSDSAAVAVIGETIADHPRAGWSGWSVAALDGGLALPEVLAGLPSRDLAVAVPFMVAEGILRDRMQTACQGEGVGLVSGALGDTDALARLALRRADEAATSDRPTVGPAR